MWRVRRLTFAAKSHVTALLIVASKSFASRRHLPSQSKLHSTTQRLESTSNPAASRERLMILILHFPMRCSSPLSICPAYPPSAKMCPSLQIFWEGDFSPENRDLPRIFANSRNHNRLKSLNPISTHVGAQTGAISLHQRGRLWRRSVICRSSISL